MRLAVVGVTGLVGQEILDVIEKRHFPVADLVPVASSGSVGTFVKFKGRQHEVVSAQTALALKPAIAILSAGSGVALDLAPQFAERGTVVIDNSSAFRSHDDKLLVVPEINGNRITRGDKIIANPNCSTIQMLLPLAPLHERYRIRRIVVSTYQSVTGSGKGAVQQLEDERSGTEGVKVYPHRIDLNLIPHIDIFGDNGYSREEMKMASETRKILADESVLVTSTCVRVPTLGGHARGGECRV